METEDLFQAVVLDHDRTPQNYFELDPNTHVSHAYNPLCGDRYTIYLDVEDGTVKAAGFTGNGCAVSKASVSILTTTLTGTSIDAARTVFESLRSLLIEGVATNGVDLGELAMFEVVRGAPTRVKCALLGWEAVMHTLQQHDDH